MAAVAVAGIMALMVVFLCFQPLHLLVVVMARLMLEVVHQVEAVAVDRQLVQEEPEILHQLLHRKEILAGMVDQLQVVMVQVAVAVLVRLGLMGQVLLAVMVVMVLHQQFQGHQ
jgi:hypothetical protein